MFVLLFLVALTVSSVVATLDESYTFQQYLADHKLKYNSDELARRENMFNTEKARVLKHNAANKSWKEGMNKFSIMTADEKKAFLGRNKSMKKNHSPKFLKALPEDFEMKAVKDLPKHVDWRDAKIVSPVKDQGYCGSCWAFASTATMESHVAKATGLLFEFSPQQIASCSPNPQQCGGQGGCEGATAEIAFDYVASSGGLFEEFQVGYQSYFGVDQNCSLPTATTPKATIGGYVQLPTNNYAALMNAVATQGPIAVSVDADFGAYSSGVYNGCDISAPDINHAVVLVGYGEDETTGEKYWLIRNSWSPSWGEKGYIRLHRSDDDEANCGTDTTPSHGSACIDDWDTPVKVCGTCGVLFDSSYPTGAKLIGN